MRKYDDDFISKFWGQFERHGECLLWQKGKSSGYGILKIKGEVLLVHRISYELTYGEIIDGHEICHFCDTPSCAEPSHLFSATHKDNMRDCIRKNRFKYNTNNLGTTGLKPRAILTQEKANEIRKIYKTGGKTQKQIAIMYGVHWTTIRKILQNRSWK